MAKEAKKVEQKPLIETTDLTPKPKVMDLSTGQEVEISFTYQKYGTTDEVDSDPEKIRAAIAEIRKVVGDDKAMLTALLNYATSQSYQVAKQNALAKGNFLTQDLRSKIVAFMRQQPQFAELKASDAFERWKVGYLAGKSGAKEILSIVSRDPEQFSDL